MGLSFAPVSMRSGLSAVRMQEAAPVPEAPLMGKAFAETLPGITAPMGYFDPLGLSDELTAAEVLKWREAELAHARVSMVAGLGFLVQENFHPIFPDIGGPAARQLDEVLKTENGEGIMASLLLPSCSRRSRARGSAGRTRRSRCRLFARTTHR